MKRFKWFLIGLVVFCLAIIPLAGCGVPQSEYEALQAEHAALVEENGSLKAELAGVQSDLTSLQTDYDTLKGDHDKLNADYEAANAELAGIKEVYPPRDFSSLSELQDWLLANDVSERPVATTAENKYSKALEIQEDALKDGYIVSVDLDYEPQTELYYIACATIIDGDIWAWNPETDEPVNVSPVLEFQKVK